MYGSHEGTGYRLVPDRVGRTDGREAIERLPLLFRLCKMKGRPFTLRTLYLTGGVFCAIMGEKEGVYVNFVDFGVAVVLLVWFFGVLGKGFWRSCSRENLYLSRERLEGEIAEKAKMANKTANPMEERRLRGELYLLREKYRRVCEREEKLNG